MAEAMKLGQVLPIRLVVSIISFVYIRMSHVDDVFIPKLRCNNFRHFIACAMIMNEPSALVTVLVYKLILHVGKQNSSICQTPTP